MAEDYSTIQQHQPLRTPAGWDKQEKALIVQLDETFDDIYRRFGRLRMEDMGKKFRKQIEDDEGNIAQLLIDVGEIVIEVGNKYDKVSGITINSSGIDVTGSKYVKIRSGGTFEVDSTNFKLDSANKLLKSGNWMLSENGLERMDGNAPEFRIAEEATLVGRTSPGVYYMSLSSDNYDNTEIWLYTAPTEDPASHAAGVRVSTTYYHEEDLDWTTLQLWTSGRSAQNHRISIEGRGQAYPITEVHTLSVRTPDTKLELWTRYDTSYAEEQTKGIIVFDTQVVGNTNYIRMKPKYEHFNIVCDDLNYVTLTQNSSREIKHDIQPMQSQGEKLDALQPVTFVYDSDENETVRRGLIYEDTVDVMPEICTGDEGNKAIKYVELIPILLKEIQELRARVATLEGGQTNG